MRDKCEGAANDLCGGPLGVCIMCYRVLCANHMTIYGCIPRGVGLLAGILDVVPISEEHDEDEEMDDD